MPIFARRVLQQMLDATDSLLTAEQRMQRLHRLNAANEQSLDVEWEVALIYGLAQLGDVMHESNMPGSSRLDVMFTTGCLQFAADIATVSDRGYEEASRRQQFERQLWTRVRRVRPSAAGFSYRIEGEERDGKMHLLLPDNWSTLFDQRFEDLLNSVKTQPDSPASLHRKDPGIDVSFWYVPGQNTVGGGYPAYRRSSRETQTPIYNVLKTKKRQLKACGYVGLLGIFLCDGDCEQLQWPERIIRRFLRDTTSIGFVAVVRLDGDRFSKPIRIVTKLFANPRITELPVKALRTLVENELPGKLPHPYDDVVNALNHLRWKDRRVGLSHSGGYSFWGGRYMRISSRALLELLAGTMTSQEFLKAHRFVDERTGRISGNPFAGAYKQGKMIQAVYVERDDDGDDDWITFEFTDPDPAISNFRPPK